MNLTEPQYRMLTALSREPGGRTWVYNKETARVLARLRLVDLGAINRRGQIDVSLTTYGWVIAKGDVQP